jgi:hypothetical protein
MTFDETLAFYDKLVAANPNFERKGKTVPYTSANGHMFSIVNKDGELGFRYAKADQEQFMKDHDTTFFMSHGAKMRGYVLIPETMFADEKRLRAYLQKSYEYVMSLDPK